MMKKLLAGAVAALMAFAASICATSPAHADSEFFFEGEWYTQPAPVKNAKGAVGGPWATCTPNLWDEPDSQRIAASQNGQVVAVSRDSSEVLVRPGVYLITVSATCQGVTRTTARTLRVTYYADAQTVDRKEYKRLHKGLSMKKVRKIVGGAFKVGNHYRGRTYYTKPNTVLYGEVELGFRHGKLVSKYWYAGGHD